MMRAIIRVGDTTSHGGTVIEGFPTMTVYGRSAAGLGHHVMCPKCGGTYSIVECAPNMTHHGVGVALEGMRTACGAVVIASQHTANAELTGGQGASSGATSNGSSSLTSTNTSGYGNPSELVRRIDRLVRRRLNHFPARVVGGNLIVTHDAIAIFAVIQKRPKLCGGDKESP
ncbi:PAAR domain-containing protein [Paraburkholderia sp. SIMBA_030]|uniref:PAAR domain-containing protein n=1 Tax=Paraburkholderia sp. SIMBA_030 TaxID=3085773 RepID=UPI00397807FA